MDDNQKFGITDGPAEVTVVMAAYNAGKTIERAIKSVARSVIPVHLVVVDDGSNDNTAAILNELRMHWPFVLLKQNNRGLGAARAAGCIIADTNWITLMDSDDESTPDRFLKQLGAGCNATNPVIVSCGTQVVLNGQHLTSKCCFMAEHAKNGVDITDAFIAGRLLPSGASVMIRRAAYNQLKGFNPKFRRQCELDFFSHAVAQDFNFVCVPEPLYVQHVGLDSSSGQSSGRAQAFRLLFDNWQYMPSRISNHETKENIILFFRSRVRILSLGALRWDLKTRKELCQLALAMPWLVLSDRMLLFTIRYIPDWAGKFLFHKLKFLKNLFK